MNPVTAALLGLGAIVNASIYFVLVFVTAVNTRHTPAMYVDIVAVGVTYLSFTIQLLNRMVLGEFLVLLSIFFGAVAGLLLLV
jgi:hypothetical protein